MPAVATATANLALSENPENLSGKVFNYIQYSPTGQDIIDLFTKIHNSKPEVTVYTEEDYEGDLEKGVLPALTAALRHKWGKNDWALTSEAEIGPGVEVEDFEVLVRQYL